MCRRNHKRSREYSVADLVRCSVSWLLYSIGHALSIPMRLPGFSFLYHPYNRLMLASVSCQGDMRCGPWQFPADAERDPSRINSRA